MTDYTYAVLDSDGSGRAVSLLRFDHLPSDNQIDFKGIEMIPLETYAEWVSNIHERAWKNGALVKIDSNEVYSVDTSTIIERLTAAGRLKSFYLAMKYDVPISELSNVELALREWWTRATTVLNTRQDFRAVLVSIGADPDEILAK